MKSTNLKLGWVLFSLFVWFHFIPSLYPTPYQQADNIKEQAIENVELYSSESLREIVNEEYMQMTVEEWEAALLNTYWSMWLINFLFILFGLISTFLFYQNIKYWPLSLGFVAILCLIYTLLPYTRVDSPFSKWHQFMQFCLTNSNYSLAYFASLWPIYLVILSLFSIFHFFKRP